MTPDRPNPIAPTGSRTRDHLANERTFLSWVRTALGLIGLGFVLARMGLFLGQLEATARPGPPRVAHAGHDFIAVGLVFLLLGTALSGWSGILYRRSRLAIDADRYEPARIAVRILTAIVVVGGLVIAGLVLWRTLNAEGAA